MKKSFFQFPENMSTEVRSAVQIATVIAAVHFLAVPYYLYLIFSGEPSTVAPFQALVAITVVLTVLFGISAVLSRRGKSTAGMILLLGILSVSYPPVSALLVSGLGSVLGSALIFVGPMSAFQVLPRRSAWVMSVLTVVSGFSSLLLDVLGSAARPSLPGIFIQLLAASVVIVLGYFIVRLTRNTIAASLRLQITLWTGLIVAILSITLVVYSISTTRQAAINAAQKEALAIAEAQSGLIQVKIGEPLVTARSLAQSLRAVKDPQNPITLTRDQANAMLKAVLEQNPNFLGTYTLWEPNAFDGRDDEFKGAEAHDGTGRFIPYWIYGEDGSISVSALIDYETPGLGDWYILPRDTKKEVTIAPLIYPINGVDTVMASFVEPIVVNGIFYGIAGVDAPIGFVQDIVDSMNLYDGNASAALLTDTGTLIAVRNRPEFANEPATEIYPDFDAIKQRIVNGEVFISLSPDGKDLRVFAPVDIGNTGTRWTFCLTIPFSEITAQATASAIQQTAISIGLIILSLLALWYFTGQIVRPIRKLTDVANAITTGDLNATAEIKSLNETGILANAFNGMTSQLRETLASLEQRVAERTRNLELAAEVGRTVSQVRALDVMLKDAAELIRKQFDLYYVQVYLADPSQTNLILQSGTGSVGEQLINRRHRLTLNTNSINGRAAIEKKSVVISDTTASTTFRPNPLLPNTRSEMAVPLMIGDRVVGVLDMQSENAGSLSQDALPAFEALAGQLAIAIQNANLLAQAEQARAEVESQARRQTRANWVDYLDAVHKPEETGFMYEQNKITPLTQTRAATDNALTAAIEVTGEALGNLVVEMEGLSPISRTSELVNTVARQVAQQIENLRLLESAERFRYEAEQASRRLTHEGWQEYMDANASKGLGYIYDLNEVRPCREDEISRAGESLSLPLKVQDEVIGKLVVQGVETGDDKAVALVNSVAERLGAHIEGLRLSMQTEQALAATKKRAQREQALRQITSAVRGSTDPATILRSAARELGNLLGRQTIVHMATAGEAKTAQADRPADLAEEVIANNGHKSVSSADRS